MYQGTACELASNGYMVFLMDHHDGSCSYTENPTGYKQWFFDVKGPHFEVNDIKKKLDIRVDEVRTLIDVISREDFLQKGLLMNKDARLDIDKLIVAGHSMGGSTALQVAEQDPRVKATLVNDPWLFGIRDKIDSSQYKGFRNDMPALLLNTYTFHKMCTKPTWDTEKTFLQLRDNQMKSNELLDVTITQIHHTHQTDAIIVHPFEIDWMVTGKNSLNDRFGRHLGPVWKIPRTNVVELHQLQTLVWIQFMSKIGFHNDNLSMDGVRAAIKSNNQYVKINKLVMEGKPQDAKSFVESGDQ